MYRGLLILLLVLPIENHAQDITTLLKEAHQQELALRENEAFLKYAEIVKEQPDNLFALCKCSELCSLIGNRQTDKSVKTYYFKAANVYASAALRVNPNSSEGNFAMALALGRLALISSGREKVVAVNEIKQYAEKSVRLDPSNFKAYHVLGKWNYEVSNLNIAEKALAKWLFGGLPKASLQDAILYYEKSRDLNPAFVVNYLELAKAYYRNSEKQKAIQSLKYMMPLPNGTTDDPQAKAEARRLLLQWQ
jgi:tetratricopeptide (TPR) repeat protein